MAHLVSPPVAAVLVLGLDVEHVLHVELEGLRAAGAHHARPLVHLEPAAGCGKCYVTSAASPKLSSNPATDCYRKPLLTSVPDEEVVEVVVGVRVLGLQREHRRVGRRVQLDHGLHRQRPVDEVRRLVVDVLDLDDDALVVRVCNRGALALASIIK